MAGATAGPREAQVCPHRTWNARTDQQGFLTHLVPTGESNDVANICSEELQESVAKFPAGRKKIWR